MSMKYLINITVSLVGGLVAFLALAYFPVPAAIGLGAFVATLVGTHRHRWPWWVSSGIVLGYAWIVVAMQFIIPNAG